MTRPVRSCGIEVGHRCSVTFHSERGRAGLTLNRREVCRPIWRLWSPTWDFDDATFARTAAAFENPDSVDIVIHSYRHRFDGIPGDPARDAIESLLAAQPDITVPGIVLQGGDDGVDPPPSVGLSPASGTTSRRGLRKPSGTPCSRSLAGRDPLRATIRLGRSLPRLVLLWRRSRPHRPLPARPPAGPGRSPRPAPSPGLDREPRRRTMTR